MIEAAIEKGFASLGFSGHSYTPFDTSYCMSANGTLEYIDEIKRLREKYRDKIRIYLGLEADYFAESIDFGAYDFIVGSVHYLKIGSGYIPVDHSGENQTETVNKFFGGSFDKYCEAYYSLVADIVNKTHCDIIGHFDLITKFNENDCLFSTTSPGYVNAWKKAADALLPFNKPFEINTGAIARKKRTAPYPSLEIARYISENGGGLVYSSDCHNACFIDCFYNGSMSLFGGMNIVDFEPLIKSKKLF